MAATAQQAQQAYGERTLVFEVSTLYGLATLSAALDAGRFGSREGTRRILLTSHNAAVPETATRLPEMAGWRTLAARFDTVVDWNETIAPLHPSAWAPSERELPLLQRLLSDRWGVRGRLTLVVESVHAAPAASLASIFAEADIEVYADGLMSYGPTREKLRQATASRVQRLLHLDLVPGLVPLLLSEYQVPAEPVPDAAFRAVLDEISKVAAGAENAADALDDTARRATAVLLGQYLAALNLLTAREEEQLHIRMLNGVAAAGHRTVLFKPHPTAPASYSRSLAEAAAAADVELVVLDAPMLAEMVFDRVRPELVVGCFSTAMFTASAYYGIPVARVGTEQLLERLTPYQNSNRVPVTLVDWLVPELSGEGPGAQGQLVRERADGTTTALVRAVGYCMQAKLHPSLRADTARWLSAELGPRTARYFKKRRLTALELPGGMAPPGVVGQLRKVPGSAYALRVLRRAKRGLTARRAATGR
ncbi:alpha-2,8-polysialyltransferase family protein [Streptomyces sp. XM4193]|uniref:alpha-2,8-polysialyltransferase family protein n=1 Tax=Streptomyces sp. XM4193 TaxID=2929782 RepID=UPI001FF828C6|nr:alpha-2,8-polysialyltransferase family protein [Streptomyces sp. XM4193]MCK1796885.1 alpha-2,8-polysialyltransferase family protein [Streptomyces sp. XM4193]